MQFISSLKFVFPALALLGALSLPSGADAGEGMGGSGRLAKVCEKIECSEVQETEVREVFEQMRLDAKPDREAVRELRRQIADEWTKDQPDEAKLAKLHGQIATHEANLADRHQEAMMELHDLLSAEQRKQVVELLESHAKRDHGNKGKGDKGGKGDKQKAKKAK